MTLRLPRRATPALIILALLAVAATAPAVAADAAPTALSPAEFRLADHAGQVVLVDFWASWCKPCAKSMPWLSQLAARYADQGLVVVAVNLDKKLESARTMLAELDAHVLVVHDPEGELARQHDLAGMPSAYLYDRTGTLHAQHVGFVPAEADAREQEITDLLTAKDTLDAH